MKHRLFISAGHTSVKGKDNGAIGIDGISEGVRTEEFRNLFVSECKKLGITCNVDGNNTILSDTIKLFSKWLNGNDILIEFHFNASANPKATGIEILVPNSNELTTIESELSQSLLEIGSNVLGIKNRGVKTEDKSHRGKLGWMRLKGHNILPELCFITNESDLKNYEKNKVELAKQWAIALKQFIQK